MRRLALCVGVGDYPAPEDRLGFCAADAIAVAEVFQQPEYGFESYQLIDDDATLGNVEDLIRLAFNERADLDTVVFYFAGHGCETAFDTYLVTHDWREMREGLSLTALANYADRFTSAGVSFLILLDCCHAGAALPSAVDGSPLGSAAIEQAFTNTAYARAVLAGCRASESAFEDEELRHGIFTEALLGALADRAIDYEGRVTVPSVYQVIATELRERRQVPVMRGTITGEFVLGNGFPGRLGAPVPADAAIKLDNEAATLVSTIDLTEGSISVWKASRYAAAAQRCESVYEWFSRQLVKYPQAMRREVFADKYRELLEVRRRFASPDRDTKLPGGREVTKVLGSGHFGTVYKVRNRPTNTHIAYKVLHGSNLTDGDMMRRFLNGHEAMKRLDHPRVLKVYERTEFPVGFFMEFVDGPNFREIGGQIRDEPVGLIKFLRSVAETVAHAHERKVLHRDIKPENILCRYNAEDHVWEAHLTDFDLAWYSTRTLASEQAYGAIHYVAPEQFTRPKSNESHLATVDVYSFGKLCFFGATAQDPEPLGNNLDQDMRRLTVVLEDWPFARAAAEFQELYRRCAARDHRLRLQSFEDVIDRISRVLFYLRDLESGPLSHERVLEEVAFALSGLNFPPDLVGANAVFRSLSQRTEISIERSDSGPFSSESISYVVRISPLHTPTFEGQTSHQAKVLFAKRIDAAANKSHARVERKGKVRDDYSFTATVDGIRSSVSGISSLQSALSRLIEAAESG